MNTTNGNSESPTFCIVVALDFRDAGAFAFGQAARVAARIPGSQLHLLHVFEQAPTDERRRELIEQLRAFANDNGTKGSALRNVSVGIHLRNGKPAREILQLASELDAGLIVVGTSKHPQLKNLFVGSVAEQVMKLSPCPVVVAGPRPQPGESHILVIDPPCADCLATRASSHGEHWWCATHSHHAKQAHAFSYQRDNSFATHDSEVIPTGVRF
ncbi:MAG: universal stress protein [Polyangiaceae bacterium]